MMNAFALALGLSPAAGGRSAAPGLVRARHSGKSLIK